MSGVVRSPDEILARMDAIAPKDFLGWSRELLVGFLPFAYAKPYLKDGVTEDEWGPPQVDPVGALIDYLGFAWGKSLGERGISAERSVDKIEQWLWLAGMDELLDRFLAADYYPYGRPKLAIVTRALAPDQMPGTES